MLTLKFYGRIFPEIVKLNLVDLPSIDIVPAEVPALRMTAQLKITHSQIEVICQTEHYDDSLFTRLYKYVFDLVQGYVDMFAFENAIALYAILEDFIKPDGSVLKLFFTHPPARGICTAYSLSHNPEDPANFKTMAGLIMYDPGIFLALNDLIQAIRIPNLSLVNCGRVVDGLRKLVGTGEDPEKEWPIFREAINADKAYLSFITTNSKAPRHGDRTFVSGDVSTEVVTRTWIIMNRFLEFKKGGDVPLCFPQFPPLKG